MSLPNPRLRWRVLLRSGLLIMLGLLTVSAAIEHLLELRDAARLTAGATFFSEHGRRVRYHLTGRGAPAPTLVLINGGHASLEQWSFVQDALSPVAPVLSYDRGGTGFSDLADAHDAIAEADELDQLLHSPDISGPFVLVSFSSSAPLATVFAATHLDIVKGIVFADPSLSQAPGAKTWRRILWRPNVLNPLEAFFGYTRLKRAFEGRHDQASSPESARSKAVLESTHHWLASAQESMTLDRSADEADTAMAKRPFAGIPLAVLTTVDPANAAYLRDFFERQKLLAASSVRGIMRTVRGTHSELLNDPVAVGVLVNLIRTIVDEVRANPGDGDLNRS